MTLNSKKLIFLHLIEAHFYDINKNNLINIL